MDAILLSATLSQWMASLFLISSSLGMILVKNSVHSCLCFLLSLISLAVLYLELSASFIAMMQILIYAGAILVLFIFVIIIFQDAYPRIAQTPSKNSRTLLITSGTLCVSIFFLLAAKLYFPSSHPLLLSEHFGTVEQLGTVLYIDYFFPFEAVILLFLISLVGALYIAKKV